jgi:sialidase-1
LVGRWLVPGHFTAATTYDVSPSKLRAAITGTAAVVVDSNAQCLNSTTALANAGSLSCNFVGLQPFSAVAWVKQSNTNATASIVGKYNGGSGSGQWLFYLRAGGRPTFLAVREYFSTARLNIQASNLLPFGRWSHVAVTYNGGTTSDAAVTFYVAGRAVAKDAGTDFGTFSPGMQSTSINTVFCAASDGQQQFSGLIRDVQVFNRALTDAEIAALYKEGLR